MRLDARGFADKNIGISTKNHLTKDGTYYTMNEDKNDKSGSGHWISIGNNDQPVYVEKGQTHEEASEKFTEGKETERETQKPSGSKSEENLSLPGKGEKHYGTYNQMQGMSDAQLDKAIKSHERNIKEHKDKIANPEKYNNGWESKTDVHKKNQLAKWEREVKVFTEQRDIGAAVQRERSGGD